jgi:hypothetical protein
LQKKLQLIWLQRQKAIKYKESKMISDDEHNKKEKKSKIPSVVVGCRKGRQSPP